MLVLSDYPRGALFDLPAHSLGEYWRVRSAYRGHAERCAAAILRQKGDFKSGTFATAVRA